MTARRRVGQITVQKGNDYWDAWLRQGAEEAECAGRAAMPACAAASRSGALP